MSTRLLMSVGVLTALLGGCQSSSRSNERSDDSADRGSLAEPVGETSASEAAASETSDPAMTDSPAESQPPDGGSVPDPATQNTLRVDYAITVPSHVSDTLTVSLVRGEDSVSATWMGDEFWSASEVLPTDVVTSPVVTFADDAGRLTLGTAELSFRTGTDALQLVSVTAEQFDTVRWDDDGDGISNLRERVGGTDPFLDESGELERRETFDPLSSFVRPVALEVIERASSFHESSMPASFPYVERVQAGPPAETFGYTTPGYTFRRVADVDASGVGSFESYVQTIERDDNTIVALSGSRDVVDGDIAWTGHQERSNASTGVRQRVDFTTAFERTGATVRGLSGVLTYEAFGTGSNDTGGVAIRVSYTLTAEPIDGMSVCLPVAGRIEYDGLAPERENAVTTIVKGIDDDDWRVTSIDGTGRITDDFLLGTLGTELYCDYRE